MFYGVIVLQESLYKYSDIFIVNLNLKIDQIYWKSIVKFVYLSIYYVKCYMFRVYYDIIL